MKGSVGILKGSVGILKRSVGILKGSVGILKGSVGILKGFVGILIHWYYEHWYFERWYFEPLPGGHWIGAIFLFLICQISLFLFVHPPVKVIMRLKLNKVQLCV